MLKEKNLFVFENKIQFLISNVSIFFAYSLLIKKEVNSSYFNLLPLNFVKTGNKTELFKKTKIIKLFKKKNIFEIKIFYKDLESVFKFSDDEFINKVIILEIEKINLNRLILLFKSFKSLKLISINPKLITQSIKKICLNTRFIKNEFYRTNKTSSIFKKELIKQNLENRKYLIQSYFLWLIQTNNLEILQNFKSKNYPDLFKPKDFDFNLADPFSSNGLNILYPLINKLVNIIFEDNLLKSEIKILNS